MYIESMDMKDDIVKRLKQLAAPEPSDHDVYPNLGKITMTQAAREIEKLRAQVAALETNKPEPTYQERAERRFTPTEAADFLEDAMADTLRTHVDEREAINTLIKLAREES